MSTVETPPVQDLDISDQQLEAFGEEYVSQALVLQKELALEKITDDATYQRIAKAGLEAAANIKAIEAYLDPLKERRHAAWKRVTTVIANKTAPFREVKEKASKLVGQYQYAQEQARKAAEETERKRLADEEAKNRAAQAEQLAKEGRVEEGIAVLETPSMAMAPVVTSGGAPKVKGVSKAAERYKATVTDLMTLVKAVAEGKVPILALQPNDKFLGQQANSMKQLLNYPGVKVERDFSSSFRG